MKILITGSAGFIGSALSIKLLDEGHSILGVDNINGYYSKKLKKSRLKRHLNHDRYIHSYINLQNLNKLNILFKNNNFDLVINLAAQPGVRYSIENPKEYIKNNIDTFFNILECCRNFKIKNLIYASSSSVYGLNTITPFKEDYPLSTPLNLYAATKISNELMAHSYSHLYKINTVGLRFFNVYGPFDRPDMLLQKFMQSFLNNKVMPIFNYGKHLRDFTYIDDITEAISRIVKKIEQKKISSSKKTKPKELISSNVYNVGRSNPMLLSDIIAILENNLGRKIKKRYLPIQLGDIPNTYADVSLFEKNFNYSPKTDAALGIHKFLEWYFSYFNNQFD